MALSDEEFSVLFLRVGISEEQTYGQIWKPLLENVPWDTVSEVSEDTTDGAEQSTESLVSLKPDLPLNSGFPVADQGSLVSNSFSWVDGSCVSCLRFDHLLTFVIFCCCLPLGMSVLSGWVV